MKKILTLLLLAALFATQASAKKGSSRSSDSEGYGYYQIIAGHHSPYEYTDEGGFGMRFSFPVTPDSIYLGLMFDVLGNYNRYATGHLGLALDVKINNSILLVGNYGFAVTGEDNTTTPYGRYYDLGAQYNFSEYIGIDLRYRNSDFTINGSKINQEEILYTLNIAITKESTMFFHFLFELLDALSD